MYSSIFSATCSGAGFRKGEALSVAYLYLSRSQADPHHPFTTTDRAPSGDEDRAPGLGVPVTFANLFFRHVSSDDAEEEMTIEGLEEELAGIKKHLA